MTPLRADAAEVRRALDIFVEPGSVVELRALGVPNGRSYFDTVSGYFNDLGALASEAARLSDAGAEGVYFTLNPVNKALLARSANKARVSRKRDTSTGDRDVIGRRWLLVDLDPKRPSDISSTEAEQTLAIARAEEIAAVLKAEGWPDPVASDSGNGFHLVYRIDLPADDDGLVKRVLDALDFRFSDESVQIDTTVFNPARICKLYGTVVRKGDSTPDRPHRLSKLTSLPEQIAVVAKDFLSKVAAWNPEPEEMLTRERNSKGDFDLARWIKHNGVPVGDPVPWRDGGTKWVFETCPWNREHIRSAVIVLYPGGKIGAKCHHNSCAGKGWRELRLLYEPEAYSRPQDRTTHSGRNGAAEAPGDNDHVGDGDNDVDGTDPIGGADRKKRGKRSQADLLIDLALESGSITELFHDREESFATFVDKAGGIVTVKVRSGRFRAHLRSLFFAKYRKAIGSQPMADALGLLEAQALEEGDEHRTFVRVADLDDRVALDLGSHHGAVVITAEGWQIEKVPPVRFLRPKTMLALPVPSTGGSIDELREFVNFGVGADGDDRFRLAVGWLLAALSGRGPFPILELFGEYDAGKSTMAKMMKKLVDPGSAPNRGQPKELRDLAIAARNSFVLSYDNLSYMPLWLSDAFCRLATGAGFTTRQLYSDDEEEIFDDIRPVIINGIPDVADQSDLRDRCLTLELPEIGVGRDPDELDQAFEKKRGGILGALLKALSAGISGRAKVKLTERVRMRGTARLVTAAERVLGWKAGSFLTTYVSNRGAANAAVLDASVLACVLLEIIPFEGTASKLLERVLAQVGDDRELRKKLPTTAHHLSGALRKIAPNLRAEGIKVERGEGRGRRIIILDRVADSASRASQASPTTEDDGDLRDADSAGNAEQDHRGPEASPKESSKAESRGAGDGGDAQSGFFSDRDEQEEGDL